MTRKPFDFDKKKSALGLAGKVKKNWKEKEHEVEELGELGFVKNIAEKISWVVKQEVTVEEKKNKRDNSTYYTLEWKATPYLKNHVDVKVKDPIMKAHIEIFYQTDSLRRQGNYYQAKFNAAYHGSTDLPVNSEGISAILHQIEELYKKYNISSVDESYNLGLSSKVTSKYNTSVEDKTEDLADFNIEFEDKTTEFACNSRGIYTTKDARNVKDEDIDHLLGYTSIKRFNEFKYFTGLENISVAFILCDNLETVELPKNVKTLFKTFLCCSKLKRVKLNDGLKSIGRRTFESCRSLEKIYIPESVETIGILAFKDCFNLKEINIPSSLKNFPLDDSPFTGCEKLQKIYFNPSMDRNLLDKIKRSLLDIGLDNILFIENAEIQDIKESSSDGIVANKFKNHSNNLGLNKKVQKKFEKVDAIDNISDFVDLGLPSGNLWSKCNVGANVEIEYGDYFSQEEAIDNNEIGNKVPSKDDFEELCDHCSHELKRINGANGMEFISRSNRNSIFFPFAGGIFNDHSFNFQKTDGIYWTSSIRNEEEGYEFYVARGYVDPSAYNVRKYKFPVRTVLKNHTINKDK